MIKNKYLIEWVKTNYPMMEIGSDSDLCELDYFDFENFAEWLVKKLTIPDVVGQSEQLPDGYCKWCKQTPCERLNWAHPLEDDD